MAESLKNQIQKVFLNIISKPEKTVSDTERETVRQGLQRFKMQMMRVLPFYGDIMMRVAVIEDPSIETAQTDGRSIRYNPQFMLGLTEGQRNYVLLHEVLHILLMHWKRRADRDPVIWNIACDYVVNGIIDRHLCPSVRSSAKDVSIERPAQGCFVRWYSGEAVEEFYQKIYNENRKKLKNAGMSGSSKITVFTFDGKEVHLPKDLNTAGQMDKEEEDLIEGAVRELLKETLKRRGSGGGYIPEQIIRLAESRKLPWHILLSDFLEDREHDESSYLTPERKYLHMDLIVPGLSRKNDRLGEIWAFVDSSGSVAENEMDQFMTQLYRIAKDFNCVFNIAFWDTAVSDVFWKVSDKNRVLECRPRHSGGTDINCIYEYMERQRLTIDVMLILTDGYFGNVRDRYKDRVGKMKKKTILVISEKGMANSETEKIGKVARL
ncbi:MAG: VWA-like domain-containing protein [Lachnospiraceae bacterium]|nr:VWA-like domain-containing protein [Lachnospiraceae bacterium]